MEDFSNLEKLLGIESGSVSNIPEPEIVPRLINETEKKANSLSKEFKANTKQIKKNEGGLNLEELELDRKRIVDEANMIYEISLRLLKKLEADINDKVVVPDKLWATVGPLINSVTASQKNVREINTQYRQEEHMKAMADMSSDENSEDGSVELTWDKVQKLLEDVKNKSKNSVIEENSVQEATILVDGEPISLDNEEDEQPNVQ